MRRFRGYEDMLCESYEVPWWYNLAAAVSSWILLAGFLVLPGAFTSLERLQISAEAGNVVHKVSQQGALLGVAIFFCACGLAGTIGLWVKYFDNYVWLLGHLFV